MQLFNFLGFIQVTKGLASAIVVLFLFVGYNSEAAQVKGSISTIADTVHIEFSGKNRWDYEVSRIEKDKIQIKVPKFDEQTEVELKKWQKSHVRHIKINKEGPNSTYILTFYLKGEDIESFDYLTDDPSRLIIDIYKQVKVSSSPTATEGKKLSAEPMRQVASANKVNGSTKKAKVEKGQATEEGYQKVKRRDPASGELIKVEEPDDESPIAQSLQGKNSKDFGLFDGGDPNYDRFRIKDYEIKEESIIASKQNIYIRFPMVEIPFVRLEEFLENPPKYRIRPDSSKENKEARLLLTLAEKKRFGAFQKSYEYFVKKYPNSKFSELVGYLQADMFYALYKRDGRIADLQAAAAMYEKTAKKFPSSVLSERTELMLGYLALDQKDGLSTIQRFKQFLKESPKTDERDRARFALAQGLRLMNNSNDALEIYKSLIKDYDKLESVSEAFFRIGDVYFDNKDMEKAIDSYKYALSNYNRFESVYPNAHYNLAESYFWTGSYKEALDHHIRFLANFPNHPQGGYSLTRIGELLGILGADQSKVMGAYLESYFRYRSSEGAEIARIRMLSQRLAHMREVEVRKSLEEMDGIAAKSKLPKMREFVTLMAADGLHARGEYKRALSYLIPYFQSHPTSKNLEFFRRRILRNISDVIHSYVEEEDYMSALSFYGKHHNIWLRNSDRIDVPFAIARTYEMAGVRSDAVNGFLQVLDRVRKINGTQEQKERKVNEHLPSEDSVLLRLAAVSLAERKHHKAYNYLRSIKSDKKLSPKERVERVEISAKVYEERGQLGLAKKYLRELTRSWDGEPQLLMGAYLKLASLEYRTKDYDKAEVALGFAEEIKKSGKEDNPSLWSKALKLKGDVLLAEGRQVAAVDVYMSLLKEFEDKQPLSSVRYKAGLVLFNRGDLKGAEKIWAGLEEKSSQVYFKLAEEKLANAKWKDEYKRYIDRIPAAEGL